METKRTKVSKSEIYSEIDFTDELQGLSQEDKQQVREEIGELLVEQILDSLASEETPVQGGKYKASLSPDYAKKKKSETGSSAANLDLTGELIRSIDYRIKGNSIQVGVFDSENAGKADGHNNFSGRSRMPDARRQFLPEQGQNFKKDIVDLIKETVENYKSDIAELDESKLEQISSKSGLLNYLKEELGIDSTKAVKRAVLSNNRLTKLLDQYDLLDLIDG